jgi:hypothetical protein
MVPINQQRLSDFCCKRCGKYRVEVLVSREAEGGRTFEVLPCVAKGCASKGGQS